MSDINLDFTVSNNSIDFTVQPNDITITPTDVQLTFNTSSQLNAGGTNTQLQYNNGDLLAGIPFATYNGSNLSLGNVANLKITGGTNGYVLQTDGTGNLDWTAMSGGGGGNGTPGGSNTQIQYNDSGTFGGNTGFTFNETSGNVAIPGSLAVSGNITGNVQTAYLANYATVANSVAGANISGTVANATYALTANTSNSAIIADSANSVAGANVSGTVANATYALTANTSNSANSAGNIVITTSNISLGLNAGSNVQGAEAIAIGNTAGNITQGTYAIAIGSGAGANAQGSIAIAIGPNAGKTLQGIRTIAIGSNAGSNSQSPYAIAIGFLAGSNNQANYGVGIGYQAGYITQGNGAVAVGANAGATSQGANSIAIGNNAAKTYQGPNSIAIGNSASSGANIEGSIAIGSQSATISNRGIAIGSFSQAFGNSSIAIGTSAGVGGGGAHNNITLNATGVNFGNNTSNAFFVKPIRNNFGTSVLFYDATSGEITYGTGGASGNAAGSNTQVQFNAGNLLAASSAFTFNSTSNALIAGNTVTSNYFIGSGNNLSNIQGANVSGAVANATFATSANSATTATRAATVTTNAQPNITTLGTLVYSPKLYGVDTPIAAPTTTFNYDILTKGNFIDASGSDLTSNFTLNLRGNSTTTFASFMGTAGTWIEVNLLVKNGGGNTYRMSAVTTDGEASNFYINQTTPYSPPAGATVLYTVKMQYSNVGLDKGYGTAFPVNFLS